MSSAKREMARGEEQDAVATSLLLEVGAFTRCDMHDIVFDALGGHVEAIDLGHERFADETPGYDVFDSTDEVTKAVERARGNHGDSCWLCDKWKSE